MKISKQHDDIKLIIHLITKQNSFNGINIKQNIYFHLQLTLNFPKLIQQFCCFFWF